MLTALGVPTKILMAVRSYFAGCIISAAVDFGLIIFLGTGIGHAVPVDTYMPTLRTLFTLSQLELAPPAASERILLTAEVLKLDCTRSFQLHRYLVPGVQFLRMNHICGCRVVLECPTR